MKHIIKYPIKFKIQKKIDIITYYNYYYFIQFSVSSVMSLSSTNAYKGLDRAFCIRMKSTLTKRGCHFKSSGYRVSVHTYIYIYINFSNTDIITTV